MRQERRDERKRKNEDRKRAREEEKQRKKNQLAKSMPRTIEEDAKVRNSDVFNFNQSHCHHQHHLVVWRTPLWAMIRFVQKEYFTEI